MAYFHIETTKGIFCFFRLSLCLYPLCSRCSCLPFSSLCFLARLLSFLLSVSIVSTALLASLQQRVSNGHSGYSYQKIRRTMQKKRRQTSICCRWPGIFHCGQALFNKQRRSHPTELFLKRSAAFDSGQSAPGSVAYSVSIVCKQAELPCPNFTFGRRENSQALAFAQEQAAGPERKFSHSPGTQSHPYCDHWLNTHNPTPNILDTLELVDYMRQVDDRQSLLIAVHADYLLNALETGFTQ